MEIKEKIPLVFGVPGASFYKTFKEKNVFVAELRPGLEGLKVVSRGFLKVGVVPVVICDNMMAFCMQRGLVGEVHIFSNSVDTGKGICRTGSLIAALCAQIHHIPVYMHPVRNPHRSLLNVSDGARASQSKPPKGPDMTKIGNDNVTIQGIRQYAPLWEEVPLSLTETGQCNG